MSGESIPVYGVTVNAINNGAARLNTEVSVLADVANVYNGAHDICDLVFEGTFAVAPVASQSLHVYMRQINIKGASDNPIPDANYKHTYIATIPLAMQTTNSIAVAKVPIFPGCELYVENDSGQTLNVGWTLDIKPFGYGVAP